MGAPVTDPWFVFLLALAGGAGAVVRYLVHAGFVGRTRAPAPLPRPAAFGPVGIAPGAFRLGAFTPGPAAQGWPSALQRPPSRLARAWTDADWRLLAVNAAASLIAGFASASFSGPWGLVLVTGFCGGLSTWSTLMNDARIHLVKGRLGRGLGVVALTVAVAIAAAWLGYAAAWLLAQLATTAA